METHTEPDKGLAKARETMSRHYLPELPDSVLTPDIVELFTKYSRLPQDCLQPHILQIVSVFQNMPHCWDLSS